VGNPVFHGDPPISYITMYIDKRKKTAGIKTTGKVLVVHHDVALSELTPLETHEAG
jgi:hypothetical protein